MPNFLIDEDTGVLAAEFVLGTLDSAERANAHSLLKADHGFIAMVRIWERRFGDLHLMVEPVDPDAKIFERIKAKLPVTAAEGAPTPDAQKTGAAPASGEAPNPPPVSAAVTAEAPKPPEASAKTEPPPAAAPAAERTIAPAPTLPPAADLPPPRSPENRAPPAKGAAPIPAPQPPPSLKLPDKAADRFQDGRAERRSEVTIDVIRSRRRWRAFGIFMILVVLAMGGLVAAWRVVPDRLPPQLRPSAVMMAIGLEPGPTTPNAAERKPAPPESQFDE
jgi:hypothetical protein